MSRGLTCPGGVCMSRGWGEVGRVFGFSPTVCSVEQQRILAKTMAYCCYLVEAWGAFIAE